MLVPCSNPCSNIASDKPSWALKLSRGVSYVSFRDICEMRPILTFIYRFILSPCEANSYRSEPEVSMASVLIDIGLNAYFQVPGMATIVTIRRRNTQISRFLLQNCSSSSSSATTGTFISQFRNVCPQSLLDAFFRFKPSSEEWK